VTGQRLSLHARAPELLLVPARVSLAWWDGDEPVIIEGPNGPCTVVIRWPTDEAGRLDREALGRGEVHALRWDIGDAHWRDLAFYAPRWNLREHDLSIGDRVRITARTLRSGEYGLDLEALARKAIDKLEQRRAA
jgi:hypothetical protein